jgi:hypothetical protein
MRLVPLILTLTISVLVSNVLYAANNTLPDPREKVDTAISEIIRLVEAREYATFIQKYAPPDDLKKILANKSLDELVKEFAQKNAARLIKVLRATRGLTPIVEENATKVTYHFKEPIDGKESIIFIKIGKFWYIQN